MPETTSLSMEGHRRRGEAVEGLVAAWGAGRVPALEEWLSVEAADRGELLLELALVDLEQRTRHGWLACPELYLRRFPELAAPEAVLELIRREWHLRAGPCPERLRPEYLARFPELAGPLRAMRAPPAEVDPTLPPNAAWPPPPGQGDTPGQPASGAEGLPAVPGYEVLGELGRGGMGVVYKARQLGAGRVVALKMILSASRAGPEEHLRFQREGRAIGGVKHPNVVTVYEVGEHEGLPFFSLELCEGGSLGQRLAAGPLPPREAAELVARVADGMAAAHAAGVVHRDLKPDNVLLDAGSTPKVTDFGLAKRLDEVGHTQTGAVMGTPSYMAPEQARGGKEVGPAADVWALGAVLYECLTGRPPFRAATLMDTLDQVLNEEAAAPSRLNRAVPRDLETVALRCLRKDPGRRYGGAAELADDLRRWLEGRPIVARPVGVGERVRMWARRNKAVAGLAAAVVLLLVAGTAVSGALAVAARMEAKRADEERDAARVAEARETQARLQAEEEANRADRVSHSLQLDVAVRALREGELRRARELLAAVPGKFANTWEQRHAVDYLRRREAQLVLRGHAARVSGVAVAGGGGLIVSCSLDRSVKVWGARSGRLKHTLTGHDQWINGISASGGRRVATCSQDGTVRVWDAEAGKELHTLRGHKAWVFGVAISRDGKRVVSGGGIPGLEEPGELKLWDAEAGVALRDLVGHTDSVRGVAISADGARVASAGEDGMVKVWEAGTGRPVLTFRGHNAPVLCVAFSADGGRLASGGFDKVVRLWDLKAGRAQGALVGHTGFVTGVAFTPDGRRVISGGLDQTVRVWSAATGKEELTVRGHLGLVTGVGVTPDGRRILSSSDDRTVKVWNVMGGEEHLRFAAHAGGASRAVFAAGSKTLVTAGYDRAVRLWGAADGEGRLELKGHTAGVRSVAVAGNGGLLASGDEGGGLLIWDVGAGKVAHRLKGHTGPVASIAFSPDGKRLASAGEGSAKVWDAITGAELLAFTGHKAAVLTVAFSAGGDRVVSGGADKVARVWDAITGKELLALRGHRNIVFAAAYSADGRRIVTGGWDKTVRVWDADTGQQLFLLSGHTDVVNGVAFSPDGTRVASASADRTVRLWDAQAGQEKLAVRCHDGYVYDVAFSPDGSRIVTCSADGTVRVLAAPAGPAVEPGPVEGAAPPSIPRPDGTVIPARPDPRRPGN